MDDVGNGNDPLARPAKPTTITEEAFRDLIARRARTLLGMAGYLAEAGPTGLALTRPLVGELFSQSRQFEELLDAYGARNNRRWSLVRSIDATIKLFSDVSYELLHIRHVWLGYRLMPIRDDLPAATDEALAFTRQILCRAATMLLKQAHRLKLPVPPATPCGEAYDEQLLSGRLPHDRTTRKIKSASETVPRLATAFLNLAAECQLVYSASRAGPQEYAALIPDPVSEESLRYLQHRFHNLQSLYDTHVAETETEGFDPDLPSLRGYISIVFHLLNTATALAHHYERHVDTQTGDRSLRRQMIVSPELLLATLMNYSIAFANRYLESGRLLCHDMLKRYAEVGRIDVPVPRYRGFHVRPATMVAKIVRHYGSDVQMELEGESYDAGSPMEIFRTNEKINASKRRWLASEIAHLPSVTAGRTDGDVIPTVRDIVAALADQGKVVLYEQPIALPDRQTHREGTLLEQIVAEIARLLATGKIDIRADLSVALIGDKRVLAGTKLLAEAGYGEDNFGNNILLPKPLAYLRY